ncbi:MAG: gfo/Idh/MocA family oxidoreductase, partial [Planctomycetes bacterium]|nr:gfo/Idh/MocA family oxidoreductase [Planctomycetota bacterium]
DWLTPDGLKSWGDTRTIVMGTDGYIELRPTLDITREPHGDHLFLVDHRGEHYINVAGKVGVPFYGRFVRDCLDRTETAMTQAHALRAAELCIRAQKQAVRVL